MNSKSPQSPFTWVAALATFWAIGFTFIAVATDAVVATDSNTATDYPTYAVHPLMHPDNGVTTMKSMLAELSSVGSSNSHLQHHRRLFPAQRAAIVRALGLDPDVVEDRVVDKYLESLESRELMGGGISGHGIQHHQSMSSSTSLNHGNNDDDILDSVNTLIGAGGDGFGVGAQPPGPQLPFAMARVGPDTSIGWLRLPWRQPGGYNYNDTTIDAFSHIHLCGAGIVDYGLIGVMPSNHMSDDVIHCESPLIPFGVNIRTCNFRAEYDHLGEQARPGFYSTTLHPMDLPVSSTTTTSTTSTSDPSRTSVSVASLPILAELTSIGMQSVSHRYTFTASPAIGGGGGDDDRFRFIIVDMGHALSFNLDVIRNASISWDDSSREVSGQVFSVGQFTNRIGGITLYFVATFNTAFDASWSGVWRNGTTFRGLRAIDGVDCGAHFAFPITSSSSCNENPNSDSDSDSDGSLSVEMYVGISFFSIDQARRNLYAEMEKVGGMLNPSSDAAGVDSDFSDPVTPVCDSPAFSWAKVLREIGGGELSNSESKSGSVVDASVIGFDAARNRTQSVWRTELGSSTFQNVSSFNGDNVVKFMTGIYHSLISPTQFVEQNGLYLGFDKQPHAVVAPYSSYYTDLSIWDIFRSNFPFLISLRPTVARDVVGSLLSMYDATGVLPKWPLASGDGAAMEGTHAVVMFADAYLKGIAKFGPGMNFTHALEAAVTSLASREGDDYPRIGFFPNSVCETLEYALDDSALVALIDAVQAPAFVGPIREEFARRSVNWKNVWDEKTQFFCWRNKTGQFPECDEPLSWPSDQVNVFDNHYVEGDAWHWRWFVPQDVASLINLYGGADHFASLLDEFFSRSTAYMSNLLPNQYYWAGNEPDIQAVFMFNYANRPDLTQKWSRWVMDNRFTSLPDGIPGNDDYGTMSAWFTFAAMGLYPVPASDRYLLGSPVMTEIVWTLQSPSESASASDPKRTIRLNTHRSGSQASESNGPAQLHMIAHNNSQENVFVCRVQWNGALVPLGNPVLTHDQLFVQGGLLEFFMAPNSLPC